MYRSHMIQTRCSVFQLFRLLVAFPKIRKRNLAYIDRKIQVVRTVDYQLDRQTDRQTDR